MELRSVKISENNYPKAEEIDKKTLKKSLLDKWKIAGFSGVIASVLSNRVVKADSNADYDFWDQSWSGFFPTKTTTDYINESMISTAVILEIVYFAFMVISLIYVGFNKIKSTIKKEEYKIPKVLKNIWTHSTAGLIVYLVIFRITQLITNASSLSRALAGLLISPLDDFLSFFVNTISVFEKTAGIVFTVSYLYMVIRKLVTIKKKEPYKPSNAFKVTLLIMAVVFILLMIVHDIATGVLIY